MKRHDALKSELTNNEPHLDKIKAEGENLRVFGVLTRLKLRASDPFPSHEKNLGIR